VDAGLVEPLEAPARHVRRGAVAELPRHAEAKDRTALGAGRVQRAEPHRARLDVVARADLDLGVEIAPVGRHRGQGFVPGRGQPRPRCRLLRLCLVDVDELDGHVDPFLVHSGEQSPDSFRVCEGGAPDAEEMDHLAPAAWIQRGEKAGGAGAVALVRDDESKTSRLPVVRKMLLDLAELLDQRHDPQRTITPVAKVEQRRGISEETLREFFREMLLIRRFEEKVEERFRAGELPGFLHVAIGQEAVAVGVCRALGDGDVIASTHRAHGHTLAKGTHPNELMAELYGKLEGCSHGYGGSMHLYDLEHGNLGANAVVGGGLPAVVGAALAFQFRDEPRVAVAFFGDGATNIGTFHESLNLAQLWNVPAVFVLEDNHWAESTPETQHSPIRDLSKRAEAFGMKSMKVDGQDVEAVNKAAARAVKHARDGKGPVFLHVETQRLVGHYIGDPQVYRDKDELHRLQETADPIELLREKLGLSDEEFESVDREVQELVDASVDFAKNGTDPKPEDALKNIYA
jgi:acetoin:2,6-dichlorophenolindophenol oxidoreductase subunit alpha